ncbi:MAG: LicD family protein [Ruminococcus sp.]|nr:LicD family protein [Ruminococcus sp.]
MSAPAVAEDYRRDRIERCKSSESIDYRVLRDRGVFLLGAEELLYLNELEAVLTEKSVPINEAAISNNEFMIALDLKESPLDAESREELESYVGGKLLVTDDRDKAGYISAIIPVLYAPRIYGAGIENGELPHENESMNAADLLGAILFLASRRKSLRMCVYYAGHGGCTVKGAKSVESGGYDRIMSYEDAKKMFAFSKQHPDELFYFDDSYDGQLELLHKRLFECLEEFDRICRENEVHYFLGGGSLLGAARYGDIIPWER